MDCRLADSSYQRSFRPSHSANEPPRWRAYRRRRSAHQRRGRPEHDPGCLRIVNQNGATSPLPANDAGWAGEESLDLGMASAICPACTLILVEANSASDTDLYAAVDRAVTLGAKFVSNSWGGGESSGQTTDDAHFDHPGVAIVASTGDAGRRHHPAGTRTPTPPTCSTSPPAATAAARRAAVHARRRLGRPDRARHPERHHRVRRLRRGRRQHRHRHQPGQPDRHGRHRDQPADLGARLRRHARSPTSASGLPTGLSINGHPASSPARRPRRHVQRSRSPPRHDRRLRASRRSRALVGTRRRRLLGQKFVNPGFESGRPRGPDDQRRHQHRRRRTRTPAPATRGSTATARRTPTRCRRRSPCSPNATPPSRSGCTSTRRRRPRTHSSTRRPA